MNIIEAPTFARNSYLSLPVDYSLSVSPNSKVMYNFPYIPTTYKESQEIHKLNLIWRTIPNGRVGVVQKQQCKTNSKIALSNSIPMDALSKKLGAVVGKYGEYVENSYFLALAVSKDIQSSVKQNNAASCPRLKMDWENTNSGDDSGCRTDTSSHRAGHRAFGENTTFTEITNQIALRAGPGSR